MSQASDSSMHSADESGSFSLLRWIGISILILVVLAVFAFVLSGIVAAWRFRTEFLAALTDVEAEVARVQAEGEPITIEQLYEYHRVPSGARDNTEAWLSILASFAQDEFDAESSNLPMIGKGAKPKFDAIANLELLTEAELLLKKYDATLQAVHEAAQTPGECRLPIRFEDGMAAMIPHVEKFKRVVRLLALEGYVALSRNDSEKVISAIKAILAASCALEHQITLRTRN